LKHYDQEEDFHGKDRKQFRKERKLAQSTDRSKFKKTDLKESRLPECKADLHCGRVVSISGEGTLVDCDGRLYRCSLKGFLKTI